VLELHSHSLSTFWATVGKSSYLSSTILLLCSCLLL